MNDAVINGIFALSGTIVAGLISYFVAKSSKELNLLKDNVKTRQIK